VATDLLAGAADLPLAERTFLGINVRKLRTGGYALSSDGDHRESSTPALGYKE